MAQPNPRCTFRGGVAEWLKATVLKTVRPKGLVSSNLTPTATLSIQPHLLIPKERWAIIPFV